MRWLLAFDLAFIATALAVLALGPEGTIAVRADYVFLLCVVAGGTLPLAGRIEQLRRRNFLLNLRTQISAVELRDANLKLRDLSEQDPLTGALNRRGFARAFAEKILPSASLTPAAEGRAALIMVDIDHFKHFNDTHGHLAGDTCLTMVANALQEIMEQTGGFVARYGGEEFIAALRETSTDQASEVAEEIRKKVASLLVPIGGENGGVGRSLVTASLGIGIGETLARPIEPDECEAIREELIEMADVALYSAKESGRNRVEVVRRADPANPAN
nr:GGDEF domain-containing protein [Erythrobacter crassostrea]